MATYRNIHELRETRRKEQEEADRRSEAVSRLHFQAQMAQFERDRVAYEAGVAAEQERSGQD